MNGQEASDTVTFQKVLRALSPCILGILLCVVMIIFGLLKMEQSEGWSFLAVITFLPAALILSIMDVLIKALFRSRVLAVWIAEFLLIAIGVWYFLTYIYGS